MFDVMNQWLDGLLLVLVEGALKCWRENHKKMEGGEDEVKKVQVIEARARNISHNVRCTECGSQSIEDSQADIAILLRKVLFYPLKKKKKPT